MRLRQVALIAEDLGPVTGEISFVFGLKNWFQDENVAQYGLENFVAPIGGNFLEVVSPVQEGTAGGRYLSKRNGDGGYMVILQCEDAVREHERITGMGIRAAHVIDRPQYRATHFHPVDTGGILLSIDHVPGTKDYLVERAPWPPGGPDWENSVRKHIVRDLVAVELQDEDPVRLAELWSKILDIPITGENGGPLTIRLTQGEIRFCEARDGRGTGVGAIDLKCTDRDQAIKAADKLGLKLDDFQMMLCGTRVNLLD